MELQGGYLIRNTVVRVDIYVTIHESGPRYQGVIVGGLTSAHHGKVYFASSRREIGEWAVRLAKADGYDLARLSFTDVNEAAKASA